MTNLKYNQTKLPYLMLFFLSLGVSMAPPLLGAVFFNDAGILANKLPSYRLNAYGFTLGAYFFGSMCGGLFWGILSESLGYKKALLFSLVGSLIAYSISIIALFQVSFLLFFLGRSIDGAMSGRRAIILSLVSLTNKQKGIAFKLAEIANSLGLLIGPVLCGYLLNFDKKVPLYYFSTPLFVMLFLTIINITLIPYTKDNIRIKKPKDDIKTLKNLFKKGIFLNYFIYQLCWGLFYISLVPFLIIKLNFNNYSVGLFFSAMVIIYIVAILFFKKLADTSKQGFLDNISDIILIISLGALLIFKTSFATFFICTLGTVFTAAFKNPYLTECIATQSRSQRGQLMGIQTSLFAISSMLAAVLSGYLLRVSFLLPFIAALLLAILNLIVKVLRLKASNQEDYHD